MAASDSLPAGCPLPGSSPVIGRPAPAPLRSRAGPGRASPVPVATFHTFHAPYAGRFFGIASRCFTPSMAFTLRDWARLLLFPAYPAGTLTTRQASLHAADRVVAPPTRAFDIGLRPGPFPVRAADLLPGLLAVTRTGLAPAGDDEHASRRLRSSRTVLRLQGALPEGCYHATLNAEEAEQWESQSEAKRVAYAASSTDLDGQWHPMQVDESE